MRGTTRLGLVLLADRVAAAVARGGRVVDSFAIVEAEHPAESLRAELDARGLRPRVARLGIQRSAVVVKAIDLPAAVDGGLGQMVQFELERHVPFPADDAAFAFAPLPGAASGQRVLIVAAERRAIERVLQLLAETKIRPVSLAVAPHELVSLLGRRSRGERAVWIHRVGDHADLLLVAGNTLVASRSVGAAAPAALAADVRGSLAMVRWSECDALWVSGDEAGSLQDAPALGAFGLPIDAPPLSGRARRALGEVAEAGDGAALLAAAVAAGPRSPALDLLPAGLRPRRLRREQKVSIALLALTVLLGVGWLFGQGVRDQQRLAGVEAEIRRLDPEVGKVQRGMDDLERRRRLLAGARAIASAALKPLPLLRELTETLPPEVWLTTLTLDQKGAEMTGQAATASALIPLLENSPRLERVEFASPVTRGQDREQFRIRASWEAAPGTTLARPAPMAGPGRAGPGLPARGAIGPRAPAPPLPADGGAPAASPPPAPGAASRDDH